MGATKKLMSWCITYRPGTGITQEMEDAFLKSACDKFKWYFIVTEKDAEERHIHMGGILHKEQNKEDLCKCMGSWRCGPPDAEGKLTLMKDLPYPKFAYKEGVRHQYNNEFVDEYVVKGLDRDPAQNTRIIASHLPTPEIWEDEWAAHYLPPGDTSLVRKQAADQQLNALLNKWNEWTEEEKDLPDHEKRYTWASEPRVFAFLHDCMYNREKRCMRAEKDTRKFDQLRKALRKYIVGEEVPLHEIRAEEKRLHPFTQDIHQKPTLMESHTYQE